MKRIIVLVLLIASAAHAEDRAKAEEQFRNAAEAYKKGRFDVAVEFFESAYANLTAPEIAFSAAQAHRLQYQADKDPKHVKRAIELYEAYLRDAPTGGKRKDAAVHVQRMRELLRDIESAPPPQIIVQPEKPSIYISVPIDNVLLTVDGKPVERYTPIEVPPGEHTVAASADGYFPDERKIPVGQGRALVAFDPKPRPATLSIKSQPDARIAIDGRPVLLRGTQTDVPAGRRLVTVSARGRRPISKEVELSPGQELTLDAPLEPTTQRRAVKWVWIGAGALALASIVTGVVAIDADVTASDLRDKQPLPASQADDYEDARGRRDTFRTASLVLGTAALLAGGAGLYMYYADNPTGEALLRPIEQKGTFTPVTFGDGLGVSYGGRF
jgi:hypothetical protein